MELDTVLWVAGMLDPGWLELGVETGTALDEVIAEGEEVAG